MPRYPKISIVTPSFNQGEFIEETIQSVLSQNYPNLEYIVIDGGSTDNSMSVIRKYGKQLAYFESKKDDGQYDALNKGFSYSTGDILTWINSDDILLPGSLHLVAKTFSHCKDIDWITGRPMTINKAGFIRHLGIRPVFFQGLLARGFYHGRLLGFVMQEGTFWRKSLWNKSERRLKKLHFGLDFALWRNFAVYKPLIPVAVPLAAFRAHGDSKTGGALGMEAYYREIGSKCPDYYRFFMLPIRYLMSWLFRKLKLSAEIYFDERRGRWVYRKGINGHFGQVNF